MFWKRSLLPSKRVLKKLYQDGTLSLTPEKSTQLLHIVENQTQKSIELMDTLKKNGFDSKDIVSLAKLLKDNTKGHLMNNSDAQFLYAKMLSEGFEGQPKDNTKAMLHINELASKNHSDANFVLGLRAIQKSDLKKMFHHMQIAADCGHAQAQVTLGRWYLEGINITANMEKGHFYIKSAYDQGSPEATALLAEFYHSYPDYQDVDDDSLFIRLEESAKSGIAMSQYRLGLMYIEGHPSVDQNLFVGCEYLKMASMQGHTKSQLALASIYINGLKNDGESVETNPLEARTILNNVMETNQKNQSILQNAKQLLESLNK
ncbi:hypothetical protein BC833DRAFT_9869 [Globomyces pollinis-pini]|nr:hypothetical protein BC833DRAFT_9869 [Globomyces pollinis-pini]